MKTKDVLTKRFACEYNELDSMAEFIEQKVQEGWELTSKTGTMFGFRRCEPKRVKVSVELVQKGGDEEEKERFVQLCESTGWKHIFSDGKLQFFENKDLDAEPIHTDPKVKFDMVHKKCKGMRVWGSAIVAFLVLYIWRNLYYPLDYFAIKETNSLLGFFGLPLLGCLMIVTLLDYVIWYVSGKTKINKNEHPIYKRSKVGKIIDLFFQGYIYVGLWGSILLDAWYMHDIKMFMVFASMFLTVSLFIMLYPYISAKNNAEKKGGIAGYLMIGFVLVVVMSFISFIGLNSNTEMVKDEKGMYIEVYQDEIPLTIRDLGIETPIYTDTYSFQSGSPIFKQLYASDDSYNQEKKYLSYSVYSLSYDKYYETMLEEECFKYVKDYKKVDDKDFDAKEVYYSDSTNKWLILYDNEIIELHTNVELTSEKKKLVVEKLKNYI